MKVLNTLALILIIVGGINWGLVGAFNFNLVAFLFHDDLEPVAKVVYILVGIAALYSLTFLKAVCHCGPKAPSV